LTSVVTPHAVHSFQPPNFNVVCVAIRARSRWRICPRHPPDPLGLLSRSWLCLHTHEMEAELQTTAFRLSVIARSAAKYERALPYRSSRLPRCAFVDAPPRDNRQASRYEGSIGLSTFALFRASLVPCWSRFRQFALPLAATPKMHEKRHANQCARSTL